MTTHLFSNTFCKLEILFKLQRLKNERKEGKEGENFKEQGEKCTNSQARNAICSIDNTNSTIQFREQSFFKHFFFSIIPLELEHNTKYTVIELCKIPQRGLSEAFESTLTIFIYSTLKLFSNVTTNIADMNVCMHILNAYEVTMLKHLHLLKV